MMQYTYLPRLAVEAGLNSLTREALGAPSSRCGWRGRTPGRATALLATEPFSPADPFACTRPDRPFAVNFARRAATRADFAPGLAVVLRGADPGAAFAERNAALLPAVRVEGARRRTLAGGFRIAAPARLGGAR